MVKPPHGTANTPPDKGQSSPRSTCARPSTHAAGRCCEVRSREAQIGSGMFWWGLAAVVVGFRVGLSTLSLAAPIRGEAAIRLQEEAAGGGGGLEEALGLPLKTGVRER